MSMSKEELIECYGWECRFSDSDCYECDAWRYCPDYEETSCETCIHENECWDENGNRRERT